MTKSFGTLPATALSSALASFCTALALLTAPTMGKAQPWVYDFGTSTASLPTNSSSTTFFPGTPVGGGTYLARLGTQGGALQLVSPGTSLGSASELQLTAATGGSTNKFTVANWTAPTAQAYVKFKLRSSSSGNGSIFFSLGGGLNFTTPGNAHTFSQSLADFTLLYTGVALSTTHRDNATDVGFTGFSASTDQEVEVYANNGGTTTYSRGGTTYLLTAQSWDLFIDGVKISSAGGWGRAGAFAAGNLTAFGFFAETSTGNAAVAMIEDLEYTNALPTDPKLLYLHDFGTVTTFAHPYTVAPPVIATNLSGSSWTNNLSTWTNQGGSTGQAISRAVNSGTHTFSLALTVAPGYHVNITDFSFWRKRATNTGVTSWQLSIEGTNVGSGTISDQTGSNIGLVPVASPIAVTDNQVNVVLTLSGATANVVFSIDDFILVGTVPLAGSPLLQSSASSLPFFGPILVNTQSAAQSFNVNGSNLSPTAGNVTVSAPGTDFQLSADGNDPWLTSLNLPYTGGSLASTPVFVRFAPDQLGVQGGNISISGGSATPLAVAVSGQAVEHVPSTIYLHNFGTVVISGHPYIVSPLATSVPGTFEAHLSNSTWSNSDATWGQNAGVTGNGIRVFTSAASETVSLSFDVAPGYDVEISDFNFWRQRVVVGQDWSMTIEGVNVGSGTITSTSGAYVGQTPVANPVTVTDGQVNVVITLVNGGGSAGLTFDDFTLSGAVYLNGAPQIIAAPASLAFGDAVIGTSSSAQTFTLTAGSLTPASGNLLVTAPASFQVSLDGSTWTAGVNVPYSGSVLNSTTIHVRFAPTATGAATGNVTVNGGGDTTPPSVAVSGNGVESYTGTLYFHDYASTPSTNPYTAAPNTLAPGLSNSSWATDNASPFTSFAGVSGTPSLSISVSPAGTKTYTLTFDIAAGAEVDVTSFDFWRQRSSTGPANWSMTINGLAAGSGTVPTTGALLGTTAVGQPIQNLTGQVTVVLTLTGSASGGTFRLDNFTLNGSVSAIPPVYYSRGSGNTTDAIWSGTPNGTAGPAIWSAGSGMVVQSPHTVTNTSDLTIKDLTVASGGTLVLNGSTTLDVKGTAATITGTLTANDNSALSITEATNSTLAITGTASFYDLTAAPGNTITVTGGVDIRGTLQLDNGVFDASAATVTLRSTAAGTGRLGPVNVAASYTGDLKVERYIPGGTTNWRFLGSPVGGTTVANWQDDFITAGYPGSQYPNFDDPVGSGNLWPSIRKYNETNTGTNVNDGLVGVGSSTEALAQGRGYAAWSGDQLGGTAPFLIDMTGAPYVANTPINLPMSWTDTGTPLVDGWNLVSNPLPSPVLFSSIQRDADVGDFITYYNPAVGNTAVYDISSEFGTNGATDTIQSSQGFFLKASGPLVATTVEESDKTVGDNGGLFGGVPDQVSSAAALRLKITSAINAYNDETLVVFSEGAPQVDEEDALKYVFAVPAAPQIATMGGSGELIAINAYGAYTTAISIPVMVNAGVSGNYTVTATGVETLGLTCISIEDLLTGEITPLSEGTTYSFAMDAEADASVPRLLLHATVPLSFDVQDATCGGTANGQATVVIIEGPTDVTWTDEFGAVLSQQTGVMAGDVTFGGLAAGSYMVHVTSNTVCGELINEFTIDAPFVLEGATVASSATTCADTEDGSIDVMIMGGVEPYTYAWSNGADTEDLIAGAGSYTLTVTDANNCEWVSDAFTIDAGGAIAGFTVVDPTVLVNTEVVFTNTSVSGETFFWEFGDGATSTEMEPVHTYSMPGTYTVTLTVTSGDCSDVTSFDVTVELNTGISTSTVVGVSAWVSPSGFVVEHGFTSGTVYIKVLDATGSLHATRNAGASPGRVILPHEGLSTGIWFVRVTNGDKQQTFRLPLLR